jgi:RNA polymerase sigma factor (sigma-70 family)
MAASLSFQPRFDICTNMNCPVGEMTLHCVPRRPCARPLVLVVHYCSPAMNADRLSPLEVAALVERAAGDDARAWEEIHQRLGGVVWSVVRSFRLSNADAEDVVQGVWLRLAQHIGRLQQPERLPGWLATTTRNECLLVVRRSTRQPPRIGTVAVPDVFGQLENDERVQAVRMALDALDQRCRELLTLVANVPPLTYVDVGTALGMLPSSVGPTRGRCLEKVRQHRAIRAITETT